MFGRGTKADCGSLKGGFLISMLRQGAVLICGMVLLCGSMAAAEPAEGAPLFFAADVAPKELLASKYHHVRPMVQVKDFQYEFSIESDFGVFTARGLGELESRVREVQAIAALKEVSQSEAFTKSFSETLTDPVATTIGVARRPIATVTGLPGGISRYISGKLFQVRRGSAKTVARIRGSDEKEKKDESGEVANTEEKTIGSRAGKLSKRHLGYNKAKREWAQRLSVDPYSDNMLLQDELGRIAWSSTIGGFAGDFAVPGSQVFSYTGKARKLVWDKSPSQLELENEKRLKRLGVSKESIREFLDYDYASLTQKTEFCLILTDLRRIEGHGILLDLLLESEDYEDVEVLLQTLELVASYAKEVSEVEHIFLARGMLAAHAKNGYNVIPLAADYLHWTPVIADAFLSPELAMDSREVWISGDISPIARSRLKANDWEVFSGQAR